MMYDLNKLYNLDCMEVMRNTPDKYFDLAIVDPPYGLKRFNSGGSCINKYGEPSAWNSAKPTSKYFKELFRISKKQIIWGGNNFNLPASEYFIIWDKKRAQDFSFAQCEYAWTNCKVPAKIFCYNPQRDKDFRFHPTQKPVALYEWILSRYAKPGDKILDTHAGSASSLVACHNMGFDFVGCEIDEEYYRLANERLKAAQAQLTLF